MKKQILLQVMNGTFAIDATIIGKLAVHDSPNGNMLEHRVSHIKTGCFLAAFTSYTHAVDFAKRANEILDFDQLADAMVKQSIKKAKAQFEQELDAVRTLKKSYPSYIPQFQLKIGKGNLKVVRKRMKGQTED